MNFESFLSTGKVLRTYCESLTLKNVKACFLFDARWTASGVCCSWDYIIPTINVQNKSSLFGVSLLWLVNLTVSENTVESSDCYLRHLDHVGHEWRCNKWCGNGHNYQCWTSQWMGTLPPYRLSSDQERMEMDRNLEILIC